MRRYRSIGWLLSALIVLAAPIVSRAQVVDITIAPPELPAYEQPAIPEPGYIWTPGFWAYGPEGYYWVPGTWVEPPSVGLLWTPGYWGWRDGYYGWNDGYWGSHVGFYGGVDYGYGYGGDGYEGGYWENGVFAYNRTVNNFGGVAIVNVYDRPVAIHEHTSRASFNGGAGGTTARPTPQQEAVAHEQHVKATPLQTQHEHAASTNKALLASVNHGHPAVAATSKPGQFEGKGVVPARALKTGVTPPGGAPAGAAPMEKKQPIANTHPALESTHPAINAGAPLKPGHAAPKTLTAVTPPKTATIKPPPPPKAAVARPPPKPVAVVRPPAPHPAAPKPPPPKKPPPPH